MPAELICDDATLSLAEHERRVRAVAAGLQGLGVRPGDFVALLLRNYSSFLTAFLAIQQAGAIAVPINWHFKGAEIDHILADSGASALIAHRDLLAAAGGARGGRLTVIDVPTPAAIRSAYRLGDDAPVAGAQAWSALLATQAEPAAVVPGGSMFYTSGTTGRPKGVRRAGASGEQRQQMAVMRDHLYGALPHVRALVLAPLYHSAPVQFAVWAVGRRARTRMMARFDAEATLATIERDRISHLFMVPTMFSRLLALPEPVRRRYDTSSVRFVLHAGAPCPPDVKSRMIDWWGPVINEYYGGTETGPVTFCTAAEWQAHRGTVGRPLAGARVEILDDSGEPVPAGQAGQIYCRLACYPDFTYHNQPDKRRDIECRGLVTCGDVGYLDQDGYLFISDRKIDMVISGGVNIYPAEIEAVLMSMAGVRDCAVLGVPDDEYGERLLAFVEAGDGGPDESAIRSFLRARLANFKIPREIRFVSSLPRDAFGKLSKQKLRGTLAPAG